MFLFKIINSENISKKNIELLERLLDQYELCKLRRKKKKDEINSIIGRALTKSYISTNNKTPIRLINISTSMHGKPIIIGENNLFFNVSHSGYFVSIIISDEAPVGIDIEYLGLSRDINMEAIMSNQFCNEKKIYDLILSDKEKVKFFYRVWTTNEAFLKWYGTGFLKGTKFYKVDYTSNDITINNSDADVKVTYSYLKSQRLCCCICSNFIKLKLDYNIYDINDVVENIYPKIVF